MSWALDTPIRVGTFAFAAIVETRVALRSGSRVLSANGEKRPVLFLLLRDNVVSGIDINGNFYKPAEIEVLYPQAISQLLDHIGDPK